MTRNHLITGQKIDPAKLEQARTLRRNVTPAEKRLWAALRRNQLDGFHFRRQQIIDGFINPPPHWGKEFAPPPRAGEGLGERSNSPPLAREGSRERPEEGSP
jgi:hypothetical protein